jgi:hypothetical protein
MTSASTSVGGVASWIAASPTMHSAVPAAAIQPMSSYFGPGSTEKIASFTPIPSAAIPEATK